MFRKAQPVICLLLTTMLLFSLTACSEKHSNEEKPAETAVQRVTSPPSTTTAGETEGQPNTPVETTTKPETERETGRETSKETTKETTEETKKETAEVTSKEAREETTGETTTEPPKETEKAKEEVKPAEPVNISGSLAVNPGFEEVTEEGLEGWTIYLDGPGRGEIGVDTEKKIEGRVYKIRRHVSFNRMQKRFCAFRNAVLRNRRRRIRFRHRSGKQLARL
jgi:hypothetical protein